MNPIHKTYGLSAVTVPFAISAVVLAGCAGQVVSTDEPSCNGDCAIVGSGATTDIAQEARVSGDPGSLGSPTSKPKPLGSTYVKAFNSRPSFRFGTSLALDGDTAVFGAPGENSASIGVDGDETSTLGPGSGAVYVAVRDRDGTWQRQAYLKASNTVAGDSFGRAVALNGDTLAVGATRQGDNGGAVYVFVRAGTTWSQQAYLTEPPTSSSDTFNSFGYSLALEGNRLLVGAPFSNLLGYSSGAVFSFSRSGTAWNTDTTHPSPCVGDLQTYDWYGHQIALSGERVAVSERQGERAVFISVHGASGWTLENKLTLPNNALASANVALDGDTLAVTTPGAVRLYARTGLAWTEQTSLTAFNADASEGFGSSVALRGDLLAVGSSCETCRGAVSTFVRSGSTWQPGAYFTADNPDAGDRLGLSVAVSGSRIAAGAPFEDSDAVSFNQSSANNNAVDSGAAFIFE